MKKHLIISLLMLIGIRGISQELSVTFDAGYGFNIATESIIEGNSNRISDLETEFETVIYSHGRGLNFNAGIEYFPAGQIGFGLELGYLKSKKFDVLFNRIDFVSNDVYSASELRFSPFLKLRFETGKILLYSKFGYLLGVLGQIKVEDTWKTDSGAEGFSTTIYDNGLSHGGMAGLGIEYNLTDRISLSSEIRLFVQSFGPKRRRIVVFSQNGEDKLPELKPGEIQTNYVDNYTRQWNQDGSTDLSEPLTALRRFHPFSSVGLNIGIQYKLIKAKKMKK